MFEKRRFLDLVRHFIVFEDLGGGKLAKKMAGYHQFHAVNVAVEETLRAARLAGLQRLQVVTKRAANLAASRGTAASAWCGTRKAPARA